MKRMKYQSDGHPYELEAHGQRRGSSIMLWGAYMYKPTGEYVGYWPSWQMPVPLTRALRNWVKLSGYLNDRADVALFKDIEADQSE